MLDLFLDNSLLTDVYGILQSSNELKNSYHSLSSDEYSIAYSRLNDQLLSVKDKLMNEYDRDQSITDTMNILEELMQNLHPFNIASRRVGDV